MRKSASPVPKAQQRLRLQLELEHGFHSMFNLKFLSIIRSAELEVALCHLFTGCSLLEIGGGTGEQAALLQSLGFHVISIDLPQSNYSGSRCFPIIDYDGVSFPVPDQTVDVVFSSNVLEHIEDLRQVHTETQRVLKSEGYAVHIMPSHTWRWATTCTHFCDIGFRIFGELIKAFPRSLNLHAGVKRCGKHLRVAAGIAKWGILPSRHGERGTLWTEAEYFHPTWWQAHFEKYNMEILDICPLGLFYTGNMLFGSRLSLTARKRLASLFGSSCYLYVVKPRRREIIS